MRRRENQIFALLSAHPNGISAMAIADVVGLSWERTREILAALRHLGLIAPTWHGRGALWAVAGRVAAVLEANPQKPPRRQFIGPRRPKPPDMMQPDPVRVIRRVGTWERPFIASMLRPADVFDGLTL